VVLAVTCLIHEFYRYVVANVFDMTIAPLLVREGGRRSTGRMRVDLIGRPILYVDAATVRLPSGDTLLSGYKCCVFRRLSKHPRS